MSAPTPESNVALSYPKSSPFSIAVFGQVTTKSIAEDANFQQLPSIEASTVLLDNRTGVTIEVKRAATGAEVLPLSDGITYSFDALKNASELSVRRADYDGTKVSVTLKFEAKL